MKNEVLSLSKEEIKEYLIYLSDNMDFDTELEPVIDNVMIFARYPEFKEYLDEIMTETKTNSKNLEETSEQNNKELLEMLTKNLNECNTLEQFKAFPGIMYTSNRDKLDSDLDINFFKSKLKEKLTDSEYAEYLEFFKTKYAELIKKNYTSQEKINILMN